MGGEIRGISSKSNKLKIVVTFDGATTEPILSQRKSDGTLSGTFWVDGRLCLFCHIVDIPVSVDGD